MSDRRVRLKAYLFGAATVLAAQALVGAAVLMPPTDAVAGSAEPTEQARQVTQQPQADRPSEPSPGPATTERAPRSEPAEQPRQKRVRTAPSGQQPGTIRLPDGGSATLVRKELEPNAVLPVPENLNEATWWGAGLDAPSGASVFAGHVNWQGSEGPFAELWHVRVGDRVSVADADGTKWHYEVSQILTLHKNEVPARSSELFGQSGRHRAVLVTCGGRWEGGATGYEENRVVVAEPV
ncbi:class F sortase [Prauserella rugosa]|uniref:Sortase (Surface protein transpeptidase) n=1 Tax=Prauserella rugosa TaxID=43354 RepID=A0A660CG97_9PSEU|nr:class F sortase [Prauserella rugosa]KID32066.1 sortase (surface protein transpeptidase) [Prauserella sp. Am3]KMS84611.1 sortase [Streptomyces regensis]TWH20693.1 sortase (surface protein transpeptidase) [Prauserella rugosa]